MTVSLSQQIEEVELELKYRREVYPRLVRDHKKKKTTADYQIIRMEAVLATLRHLYHYEDAVRDAIKAEKAKEGHA